MAVEKAAIIADVDGNGEVNALTDALVVLRYMFGLRDEILVGDVIAADASRSSAEDISQHIELYMPENTSMYTPVSSGYLASYPECSEHRSDQKMQRIAVFILLSLGLIKTV